MGIVGKRVLVLGLSRSGIAAANFAKKHGADVYLTESRDVSEDKLFNKTTIEQDLEEEIEK